MYIPSLFLTLFLLFSFTFAKEPVSIDDWEYNSTKAFVTKQVGGKMRLSSKAMMVGMSAPRSTKKIGLSVGGAKDTHNFTDNIKAGFLPQIDAITYEGTFYQHYFDTGLQGECHALFCPSYAKAIHNDIYTDEIYYYLSVGLNSGIEKRAFKRKKLNLVVVLDISGSMGSGFNHYYYDGKENYKSQKSKMRIANEAIVAMMGHLKDEDRFGMVLFDDSAYRAKPLRKVRRTNMRAIEKHILALHERGGTNWSAGYKEALAMFKGLSKKGYENRIIFITDAMPNRGELKKERLFAMAQASSKKGIHTTFIGVGVDFNANLVAYVSKIKGANYYSVHSSESFQKRMDSEFDYMVTPLVYDLELTLKSKGFKIDAVYGNPQANLSTGRMMYVNTLFPSENDGKRTKGGVILVRLKKVGQSKQLTLSVKYKDTKGKTYKNLQKIEFNVVQREDENGYYDNPGIHKAILLSEYVSLMKNWILDSRMACQKTPDYSPFPLDALKEHAMSFPPKRAHYNQIKSWEHHSCRLEVNRGYKQLFSHFRRYFKKSIQTLHDRSLTQELKLLERLEKKNPLHVLEKVDDWNM